METWFSYPDEMWTWGLDTSSAHVWRVMGRCRKKSGVICREIGVMELDGEIGGDFSAGAQTPNVGMVSVAWWYDKKQTWPSLGCIGPMYHENFRPVSRVEQKIDMHGDRSQKEVPPHGRVRICCVRVDECQWVWEGSRIAVSPDWVPMGRGRWESSNGAPRSGSQKVWWSECHMLTFWFCDLHSVELEEWLHWEGKYTKGNYFYTRGNWGDKQSLSIAKSDIALHCSLPASGVCFSWCSVSLRKVNFSWKEEILILNRTQSLSN